MEVGDRATRTRVVSAKDIELFTAISGDRNPLHYDADLAEGTRFGGIIVQGGVTSALLNTVVSEDLPGPGSVFMNINWNFRAPVRPGDVITAEVAIVSVRDDKPVYRLECEVVNQNSTVVLDGSAVVWREPLP